MQLILGFLNNALSWWHWLVLGAIPPLIIALYFLKLKRQPLEVPSTYLWRRTIEDLHVNSLWQRLRKSLLLFLQLLLIAIVMLACLRPSWQGRELVGERFIFLVDTSASMGATDLGPTRLEVVKQRVNELIDQMTSSDTAMLMSFSDRSRVEQEFTQNRRRLRRALAAVKLTHRTTSLDESLRYSAGRANPADSREGERDVMSVAEALPATLYIFSDGNVPDVADFSLGNLEPVYTRMGTDGCQNIGITAFSAERHPEKPDRLQVFGRLRHFQQKGASDEQSVGIQVGVDVFLDDHLIDSREVQISEEGTGGIEFSMSDIDSGVLKMQLQAESRNDLAVDDVAYASVNRPKLSRVLLLTSGNDALHLALGTEQSQKLATVRHEAPGYLNDANYQQQAEGGLYDLIIYDQCAPETMPQANTLFIGQLPPMDSWTAGRVQSPVSIIDTDRTHPLMQFIEMGNVEVVEATPVSPPRGGTVLIDSDLVQENATHAALFAIAPRERFEDAVLGFRLIDSAAGEVITNWPIRISFPLFMNNVLSYLGSAQRASQTFMNVQPGQPVIVQTDEPLQKIQVVSPDGSNFEVTRTGLGHFTFTDTEAIGVYKIKNTSATDTQQLFTVNLFDSRESNIWPQLELEIGHETVSVQATSAPTRREAWKYLLVVALAVALLEWYIFNRRVYL